MKTITVEKSVEITYKNDDGKKLTNSVDVDESYTLPISTPQELADYVAKLDNDSHVFTVIANSLESVTKSKLGYKLASYELKPSLDIENLPEEYTLEWICEPLPTGRFGYAKAAEQARTEILVLETKLDTIKTLVSDGMADASLMAGTIGDLQAEISNLLDKATKLEAKAAEQAEQSRLTRAANAAKK